MSIKTKLIKYLAKDLSSEEKNEFFFLILDTLNASPLYDIIYTNEDGNLIVDGSPLEMDRAKMLREHAKTALDNKALRLIREQVKYMSFVGSAVKAQKTEDLVFYRAALWWGENQERLLNTLAQREQTIE